VEDLSSWKSVETVRSVDQSPDPVYLVSTTVANTCLTDPEQQKPRTCCSYFLRNEFTITSPFRNHFELEAAVLDDSRTAFVTNEIVFHKQKESIAFNEGSMRIFTVPNAGGNSIWSEALSYEILANLFNAKLQRTEMELEYIFLGCKITDYSITLLGENIGVSVTRAMKFHGIFDELDAQQLLQKKLYGVNASSKYVVPEHGWKKQILHIFAEKRYVADMLMRCYHDDRLIDQEPRNNTIVIVTVADADWIFKNA